MANQSCECMSGQACGGGPGKLLAGRGWRGGGDSGGARGEFELWMRNEYYAASSNRLSGKVINSGPWQMPADGSLVAEVGVVPVGLGKVTLPASLSFCRLLRPWLVCLALNA